MAAVASPAIPSPEATSKMRRLGRIKGCGGAEVGAAVAGATTVAVVFLSAGEARHFDSKRDCGEVDFDTIEEAAERRTRWLGAEVETETRDAQRRLEERRTRHPSALLVVVVVVGL